MSNFENKVNGIMSGNAPWSILFEHYGKQCPKCGAQLVRPRKYDDNGNKMPGACMTKGCRYKEPMPNVPTMSEQQRSLEQQARYNEQISYFKKYSVYTNFSNFAFKTFDHYKPVDAQSSKAKQLSETMAHDIAMDRTVHGALFGSVGVGKTHLANAIFEKAEAETHWSLKVQFIDIALAVEMNARGIRDDEARKQINDVVSQFSKSDLVIIDDLGAERNTDWGKSMVDKLMRLREDKSVIVTSNLSGNADGFGRYTSQTLSRLKKYMSGHSITMDNTPDYRSTIK